MRKVIAAINMTVDGVFDHTAVDPDDEVHDHYTDLLRNAGILLYGRITYELMAFWRTVVNKPTDNKALNDFAVIMNTTPKLVFSRTLKGVDWDTATLANGSIEEEVAQLKQQPGNDIFIGSRSIIMHLLKLNLVDEFQLCIHPVIAGSGRQLFESLTERNTFRLLRTKTFGSGAIILYYEPSKILSKD